MGKLPDRTLSVEAQLRTMTRSKDGTVNYGFRSLNEMTNEEFALGDQYHQQTGHLVFKLDDVVAEDIPEGNTVKKGQVSPSQYLRTRLFAKHMASGGTKDNFPPYYERAIYGFAEAVDNSYTREE